MKESSRDLKLNIVIGMSYQVLTLIINYFSKQAVYAVLGQEYLGMQAVYANVCDVLVFSFHAVGIAMLFQLYRALEEKDEQKIRDLFCFYNRVYRIFTAVAVGLGFAATALIVASVNGDVTLRDKVLCYWLFVIAYLVYNRYLIYFYFFMANQKRYVGSLVYCLCDIAGLFFQVGGLYATGSYYAFLLAIFAKNAVAAIVLALYFRKRFPYMHGEARALLQEEKKSHFRNIADMIISRIGNLLMSSTDSVITSAMVGTVVAGAYSNYSFLFLGVQQLIQGLYDAMTSKIGQMIVREEKERQFQNYRLLSGMGCLMTVLCVSGFWWLCQPFITLWMGEEVLLAKTEVFFIALWLYMKGMRQTSLTFRQSAGLFHKISGLILFRGILNIVLSIGMGWKLGLTGILAATVISDAVTVYWYEPYMLHCYFGKSCRFELFFQAAGLIVCGFALWLSGNAVSFVTGTGWAALFAKAFLVLGSCLVWMVPLVLVVWMWNRKKNR